VEGRGRPLEGQGKKSLTSRELISNGVNILRLHCSAKYSLRSTSFAALTMTQSKDASLSKRKVKDLLQTPGDLQANRNAI